MRSWALALSIGTVALLVSVRADAAPQVSAGLTVGGALTGLRTDGPRLAYHMGGRADVLFLRDRSGDMAIGPYVDVATAAFDTFETGGGFEWLVPTFWSTATIFSAGPLIRKSSAGWEPGAEATIFFGSRDFNFDGVYGLGVGGFLQGRYGFGDTHQADAIIGLQLDLALLAMPFVFAYEAAR